MSEERMEPGPGPTARRRQLGYRLLTLREATGLSADQAGQRAGVSKATVSRYERGKGNVRWNQVDQLCRVYGVTDEERETLVELAKNSRVTDGWWVPVTGKLPHSLSLLIALETEASTISYFSPGVIPGLLQTLEYARAIKPTPGHELPAHEVDKYLAMRMQRQQILEGLTAPKLQVVLDEAVIRRVVGSPAVMAAQLDHLLDRARQPNVSIQVLPFTAGAYSAALNAFVVYGAADPTLDVIYVESPAGSLFLEEESARREYTNATQLLRGEAMDTETSASLIADACKSYRDRFNE